MLLFSDSIIIVILWRDRRGDNVEGSYKEQSVIVNDNTLPILQQIVGRHYSICSVTL